MPPGLSLKRALGAVLAAALLPLAGPVSTLAASQPDPGYAPAFVTEREAGPWEDCIWAAAAMLLDKWTNGERTVGRERLRTLSGDRSGGSNLADVRRAFQKLKMGLKFSPGGGASIGWSALLDRLAKGGGAILLGDYGKLPSRYGRWDRDFWSRRGTGDDHALYLDRYDRRTARILVMDPLAPAGWGGEWIPVTALKRFAWRTGGGSLWVALTPPARVIPPLEGVALGNPFARMDGGAVQIGWRIEAAPQGWTYRGANLSSEIVPLGEIDHSLPVLQAAPGSPTAAGATPGIGAANGVIEAGIPLPAAAGLYRLTVGVSDPRSGRTVGTAGPYSLYVPGPRAASLTVPAQLLVEAGGHAQFPVLVTNNGTESWADPPLVGWLPIAEQGGSELHVVGRWLPVAGAGGASPEAAAATEPGVVPAPGAGGFESVEAAIAPPLPPTLDLGTLHLETGEQAVLTTLVQAPPRAGQWLLVFEVVDANGQSLALSGSAPGIIAVDVLPAGLEAGPPA